MAPREQPEEQQEQPNEDEHEADSAPHRSLLPAGNNRLEHYTNIAAKDIDGGVVTQFDTAVPRTRAPPRDALVLGAAMAVANAGNYAFNVVMAFLLGPEAYGALAALLALVLVGSVPGLAPQARGARGTTGAGGALALALAPTALVFATQGLLQGRERFGALAAVMVAGAAVKLAAGLA